MKRFVQPSKTVTDAQKIAAAVEAASVEVAPAVAPALETTFVPWVREGETAPAQEELRQVLLGRWLRQVRERLVAADEAHQREIRKERSLRRRRDDSATEIRGKMLDIRTTFERVYGAGLTAEIVGLASDIPRDPVVLERYALRVIDVMRDEELVLPEPRVKGSTMGPEEVAGELSPPLEILGEALARHEPQKRRTQVALHEKRQALEAFNFAVGRIARYLEALCYLAGMDFHAERVRQSSRTPVEEDETFESPEEEASKEEVPEAEVDDVEPEPDDAES